MATDLQWDLPSYQKALERRILVKDIGKVTDVSGMLIEGFLPGARVGSICQIHGEGGSPFKAEVIGFRNRKVMMMALSDMSPLSFGARIELLSSMPTVKLGNGLLGRVINGLGEVIDGKEVPELPTEAPLYKAISNPLERDPIAEQLDLGVKSLNAFVPVGKGQRVGIMAGSGVGKSVLLGMIARRTQSDVNVIALIGERGREVREFIEDTLGEEGMKKSILVVVTSDASPLLRMRGAFLATTIAEHFSDQGKNVLLMMDSLTRFSMAQREISLSLGDPVTSKGYTPSVFSTLPKLLERAGNFTDRGSVTGLYTVLVEGDDMDEPIADAVRSIVDGHIVLDRKLAHKQHFPAIDILQSASRVFGSIYPDDMKNHYHMGKKAMAIYREQEDLINIGAYSMGQNPDIDQAIHLNKDLNQYLTQSPDEEWNLKQCFIELERTMLKHEEF